MGGGLTRIVTRKRYLEVEVRCLQVQTELCAALTRNLHSLFLAKQILQLHNFPVSSCTPFIDTKQAPSCKVIELGAGTGVLGILLHQLFRSWTASDQYDHLKLIARNVKHNGDPQNIHVEEVDWIDIHAKWTKATHQRNLAASSGANGGNSNGGDYDLVIAVDCIYNEALIPPFVSTLEYYTTKGKTIALVVCELRSADVVSIHLIPKSTLSPPLTADITISDDNVLGRMDRSWRLDDLSLERDGSGR